MVGVLSCHMLWTNNSQGVNYSIQLAILAFYYLLVTILKLSLEQLPGCHCLSGFAYLVWKAPMIIGVSNSRSCLCKLCIPLPMC